MSNRPPETKVDPTTWVDEHGDILYRFALLRVRDPHVAEDLVQETFISALEGLVRFKGGSAVRTWLVGILKHKVIDYFRKSNKEVPSSELTLLTDDTDEAVMDRLGEQRASSGTWDDGPDKALEDKEFWKAFLGCLDGLPVAFRRAFALREMDGLKTEEICKILDITSTNLWVILHRARARLRDCLDAKWFRPSS